ncbi:hypothetical protein EK904_004180 [Melospiza melodia maxima]|nr:hypothetical protein EK904_004180 [Melospiza melodia maxima]
MLCWAFMNSKELEKTEMFLSLDRWSLKNTVFKVVGQVKGKTLLPLPAASEGIENIDPKSEKFLELINKSLVHATESAIIEWSQQIQRVLRKESSEPLLQGTNPTPKVELQFWRSRCADLEGIHRQLTSRRVSNMLEVLERVQSIYVPAFQSMLGDVEAALREAQDIDLHLTALQQPLERLEAAEFSKAVVYLSPEDLLKGEVEESLGKVQTVFDILSAFKGALEERRADLQVYYEPGQQVRSWDFPSRLVFARLDSFLQRLHVVKGLLSTALDLAQLEKIEFGGMRGKALGQQVLAMHEEFQECYQVFSERAYDCLDLANGEFEQDALEFQQKVQDIDRRLGTVFSQAFSDAPGMEHIFKLLAMFQNLLERPGIAAVAADKVPVLLSMFSSALDQARLTYSRHTQAGLQLGFPPLHKNAPPVAGALGWAQELRARIQRPLEHLRHVPGLSLDSARGRLVMQKYEEMIQLLDRYQEKLYLDWSQTVSEKSQYNLAQPLIRREAQTKLIRVNFDPQLVAVLREVTYLRRSGAGAIPPAAAELHSCKESLWQLVASLELMANSYNKVLRSLLEVEHPLVQGQLQDIDRVQKAKDNVEEIQSIVRSWGSPMLERRDPKREAVLSLEECQERLERRYSLVREAGHRIHSLVEENQSLLRAEPASDAWKGYLDCVDEIVLDGFFTAIECSLKYLLENTDPKAGLAPLFEVQLDLVIPDLVFRPPLDPGTRDGFCDMVERLLQGIFHISSLVSRLAAHSGFSHYQAVLEAVPSLCSWRQELLARAEAVATTCREHRAGLERRFCHLLLQDRRDLGHHLHVPTPADTEEGLPEAPAMLQQFREQLGSYEQLYEDVARMQPLCTFQGWLRLDVRPFKAALLNEIKRWSLVCKQHLLDRVTHSLADLDEFIQTTERGLSRKVEKGDYSGLVEVMGHLLAVKERHSATDAMFEPLKETIELLRAYEQQLPEEIHQQLEELPEKWGQVKKLAVAVKQQVAPLQAAEHMEIKQMESAMTSIYESAGLFEVMVPEYKQLKQCRKELCLLKELWDMISLVNTSLEDWQTTRWVDINVENMDLECKKFAREIRNLDKEMRAWDAFSGLESKVKNMLTALKAVAELQNPAIRERHWNQLMQVTGVRFVMDSDTTLADLLKLDLHEFEGEVHGIVDKAVREMSMEKVLKELRVTWSCREFQYEPHPRTHTPLLKSDEELVETLEDNQVQLQNLMSSKYIAFFLEEVSAWQRKLSTADSVISLWFEVQRTWSHLESIFIGSEDIRAQLPQDSKRFEGIHVDFKELANEVQKTPNVVEATNKAGLSQQLEDIQSRLSLCEKALAEYLDMKRLAFPRFYFISSADLLDILSNGTNPQLLFDNLASLKFQVDSEEKTTKTGVGMYSREEEYVQFSEPCDCSGQVEVWLGRLLDAMRATVRDGMCAAVAAYEDKPREQWLFDHPAQLRHRWSDEERHCWVNICDAQFLYCYEYLGNTPRLSCGNIYKGLSQTGAWGCFDEFNRISVEVLSVVAVQVKSVQDAIREKKKSFNFLGEDINLVPSVGIFITMNPGYAGRTELPENLKALFRPCAMVVPDFELICEIMLVAEGFLQARALARKFITLYQLCKELLSKQDHYDWGLRAIKSVLVVAGSLKRADPERPEEQVLMRSLRDFNIPKIVTDDVPVFMGLIGDLFPALDVPRKRDLDFEAVVVQLEELLSVRHSVFVVGAAGTGKSQVLRSLHKTYQRMKRRPVWTDLNPKAVTNDELFGVINPATREWRDGLFSSIMRELANISHDGPKWMVLDGDIDPMWIESLNTVMDDNKVLTLASNERIPLNPMMRLLFEISHLHMATPATVSRAGILYINPSDLGWNAPVSSWIDRREVQSERANLTILFDKYLPVCLDTLRARFKKIIPIPEQSMVQMLCYLLECLLTEDNTPPDCPKELYELYFVFAAVWAFGGSMFQDQLVDYRVEFSKWWVAEFKTIKFPSHGTVFDFYVDPEAKKFEPWSKLIPQFEFDPEVPLQVGVLEKPLEKKAGRNYGPPGTKRLVYFMDDLNMPQVDAYGTVQPHTLLRQHLDYGHWYDRSRLSLKEISNVQYVSCMNPTAGSFTINPRLQRHFCVFALSNPDQDSLSRIYSTILVQHLASGNFSEAVQKSAQQLVALALGLHRKVAATFLPTAVKFHYVFNLRDLSNIFQGLLFSTPECLKQPQDLVKLYLHESNRVYRDRMVEEVDGDTFDKIQREMVKKCYDDIEDTLEQAKHMNIYCHFAKGLGEPGYRPVPSWEELNQILVEALDSYNEVNAAMDLVLFEDAMSHV